jgi:hypothetical protein
MRVLRRRPWAWAGMQWRSTERRACEAGTMILRQPCLAPPAPPQPECHTEWPGCGWVGRFRDLRGGPASVSVWTNCLRANVPLPKAQGPDVAVPLCGKRWDEGVRDSFELEDRLPSL